MAVFTKTLTTSLLLVGGERTNNWGEMLWGDNWLTGNHNLAKLVKKQIPETVTLTDSLSLTARFRKTMTVTLTVTGDMGSERLLDSAGYYVVFGNDSNAENRPNTSYNEVAAQDVTFTTQSQQNTTWTRV